jgi:hypothetical protein
MDWKEHRDAVAFLYQQVDGIGRVRKNLAIAYRVTGQSRRMSVALPTSPRFDH